MYTPGEAKDGEIPLEHGLDFIRDPKGCARAILSILAPPAKNGKANETNKPKIPM